MTPFKKIHKLSFGGNDPLARSYASLFFYIFKENNYGTLYISIALKERGTLGKFNSNTNTHRHLGQDYYTTKNND